MKPLIKLAAGACVVAALGLGLLAANRSRPVVTAPNPAEMLTAAQPEDGGTEPTALPPAPVLTNSATEGEKLAVSFGYKLGTTSYAYRLGLTFPAEAENGTMDLAVARGRADEVETVPVKRHWSDSRHAYLVAAAHDFPEVGAPVPNLCIRAVLGPSKVALNLHGASLCVMQRDADGRCHPSTLACGQLR